MIKVAVAVPYKELISSYRKCIEKIADDKDILFETEYIKGTKDNFIRNCSADIVIARGITSLALRQEMPQAHMIEIEVTGYDVFNALIECSKKYKATHIAIIASETILCNLEALRKISGYELELYRIKDEADILHALNNGIKAGVTAFIGGTTTVKICEEQNIACVGFLVGNEAMETSVRLAVDAAESINKERSKTTIMKKVINNTQNGVIAINKNGMIEEINFPARKIFNLKEKINVEKLDINSIFFDNRWKEVMESGRPKEIFYKLGQTLFVINITPLIVAESTEGVLMDIQNAEQVRETETKIRAKLRKKGFLAKYTFNDILGESETIKTSILMSHKYSRVDSNVLIVGETGTGKELFAHSIHNASRRSIEPFVAVNCAAVPEHLLESELFGYTEGAFSGAVRGGKIGLFELAHRGTIFLDEIGEMPITLQAKLLRVLEEREVRRIGDDRIIPIDVRVISATNINMEEKIKNGEFRSDLYYRINLLDIHIAPLRQRNDDVAILAKKFVASYGEKIGMPNVKITNEALEILKNWRWPGNIRELRNICERLVVLCDDGIIGESSVKELGLDRMRNYKQENECDDIIAMLGKGSLKKEDVAKSLGISRTTLWRRMKETKTNTD